MVQVINRGPSLGGSLGTSLGEGIGGGLRMLLNRKMEAVNREREEQRALQEQERQQQLQAQQKEELASQYEALGLPPGLASLNPTIQKELLQQHAQERQESQKIARETLLNEEQKSALEEQYKALGLPPGLSTLNPTIQKQIMQEQAQDKLFSQLFGGGKMPDEAGGEEIEVGEEMIERGPRGQQEFTDEQIAAVTLKNPQLGATLQRQKEAKFAKASKEEEFGSKRAQKFFENLDERSEGMVQKEMALSNMEDALKEGNLGYFTPDNLANITGIEGLRSPKGAQFITSGKEFFLGSLKRAGARPNQWIEQQIQKMLPQVGRSREANLTVVEALKSEMAIERKQQEIAEELLEAGIPKGKIMSETNKRLREFAVEEQKQLRKRLGEIAGQKDFKLKKVKPGTKVTTDVVDMLLERSKGDVQAAKKLAKDLGYEF